MKKCIWCLEEEPKVSFKKIAHTIPQSLGGKNICLEVCDTCNEYFGQISNGYPAVEETIKEAFNVSKHRLLNSMKRYGAIRIIEKVNIPKRFTSRYFDVNFEKSKFKIKSTYWTHKNFQDKLVRQFKKGIYKLVLEEIHRQKQIAHNDKFNFIRLFCRQDFGDLPVYYFNRRHGVILTASFYLINPELIIDEEMESILKQFDFFEFEILHHKFAIPLNIFNLTIESYLQNILFREGKLYKSIIEVKKITDIDLTLSIFGALNS